MFAGRLCLLGGKAMFAGRRAIYTVIQTQDGRGGGCGQTMVETSLPGDLVKWVERCPHFRGKFI